MASFTSLSFLKPKFSYHVLKTKRLLKMICMLHSALGEPGPSLYRPGEPVQ